MTALRARLLRLRCERGWHLAALLESGHRPAITAYHRGEAARLDLEIVELEEAIKREEDRQ